MDIPVKKTGGFELPVLGLGTWRMGGDFFRNPFNDDKKDIAAIREAIRSGIVHIDTAEIYANGHAEELVAEAISEFDRDSLFITSKVSSLHLGHNYVLKAAQASLGRLRTGYLDLYLIHAPNIFIPLKETMKAMDELVDSGLVRNIGVSNFNIKEMEEAQACARHKIVNNQFHFSLEAREYQEDGVLDYCRKNQILITAYRPLSKGKLTELGTGLLDKMAAKYGRTPAQISLNWVLSQPGVVTLVKTSSAEHLKEDLGAVGWSLDEEDARMLNEQFPRGRTMSGPRIGR